MGNNFSQSNVPQYLDIQSLRSAFTKAGDVAKGCRFAAVIRPNGDKILNLIPRDLIYMCESVEFPGRGFDVTQIRYWGAGQVFPNNTLYETSNMSFICRQDSVERAFFDNWMDIINPTTSFTFEYPENYYATIQIYHLSEVGGPVDPSTRQPSYQGIYGWSLYKAWPTLIAPQQVTWADQDILRLQVTLTYKYWDRPDYNP
jgi:hypothetical protein